VCILSTTAVLRLLYRDVYLLYMQCHNETCITYFVLQHLMIVGKMTVKLTVTCVGEL